MLSLHLRQIFPPKMPFSFVMSKFCQNVATNLEISSKINTFVTTASFRHFVSCFCQKQNRLEPSDDNTGEVKRLYRITMIAMQLYANGSNATQPQVEQSVTYSWSTDQRQRTHKYSQRHFLVADAVVTAHCNSVILSLSSYLERSY